MLHGKEIYIFFNIYNIYGIFGIILSNLIIAIIIYKTYNIIYKFNITNYNEFLKLILKDTSNLTIQIINNIVNIFLLISFFIMVSASGAYFEQEFNVSNIIGILFFVFLCYVIFNKNINGIVKSNVLLIPILIIVILFLGIQNVEFFVNCNINKIIYVKNNNWILDSILYASYNSILLIPILISLNNYINNKKSILKISFITMLILDILGIIIFGLILRVDIDINKIELPTLYAIEKIGVLQKNIYSIIIFIAILTSTISSGYGVLQNYKNKKTYKKVSIIICIIALFVSNIGFSKLITILYPMFGYLGIIQILIILLKKNSKTDIN